MYGHAVLAESESSIARLLQSLSAVTPTKMPDMWLTLLTSKARGWLKELVVEPLNIGPANTARNERSNGQTSDQWAGAGSTLAGRYSSCP